MASAAKAPKKTPKAESEGLPLEEQIRRRAYEIYLQRGGQVGSDLDDWLQAEEEIQREQQE